MAVVDQELNPDRATGFRTTHWTEVLEAAQPGKPEAVQAFARIYTDYWHPLYAYTRRRGCSPHEAEDVLQDFFARLLEKEALAGLEREGGKFRSFLLGSLKHFLANLWDRSHAQKRGNGQALLALDAEEGETRFLRLDAFDSRTPETIFEQQWTFTLLERVMERLAQEQAAAGKAPLFEHLRPFLHGDHGGPPYAEVAGRLGLSEGAVKVAVHRLRQRYGRLLREQIATTVSTPEEVEAELRHLIEVVSR
jgi:RNA polymerase sigma factor (sigma-70 family)